MEEFREMQLHLSNSASKTLNPLCLFRFLWTPCDFSKIKGLHYCACTVTMHTDINEQREGIIEDKGGRKSSLSTHIHF